jgi:Tfp pilus assembly protein PilE
MTRTQKTVLGIAIGVLVCSLVIAVVGILLGAATVSWKSAVRAGNEVAAKKSLRTIAPIEIQYYNTHNRKFGTFEELIGEQLLDARFRGQAPVVDGYVYQLTIGGGTSNAQPIYFVTADPQDRSTGTTHFYLDSSSREIHVNPNQRAGPNDPPLDK